MKLQQDKKDNTRYITRYNDSRRIKWDFAVIIFAIYNCGVIPFDIAFNPEITSTTAVVVFDYLVDVFFVMDILINFRTTFINKNGEEVYDTKIIGKRYLGGGRFWIDFLSVVPLEEMSGGSV